MMITLAATGSEQVIVIAAPLATTPVKGRVANKNELPLKVVQVESNTFRDKVLGQSNI